MDSYKNLDIDKILDILDERVLQHTGRHLLKSERVLIKGSWYGRDYKEIASNSGYSADYLHREVARQLWAMLSEVIGDGVPVKKISLKPALLKLAKKNYFKLEVSKLDNDCLVGKTRIYGELPKIESFYGREREISKLKNQLHLLKRRCIVITGVGGIGKTSLAAKLVEEILLENPNAYEDIVWIKIHSSIDDLFTKLINAFNVEIDNESLENQTLLLLKYFKLHRLLLVVDGFEKLGQVASFEKRLEYEKLFIQLADGNHQNCTIITSQLPLEEVIYATKNLSIDFLRLEGLEERAAMRMLNEKGLWGKECKELIKMHRGNPSELEEAADRIHRLFGGSVKTFFDYRTTVIGQLLQSMLHQQFGQPGLISDVQREIMIYLAESTSESSPPIQFSNIIEALKKQIGLEVSIAEAIRAIEILEQRSLVETYRKSGKQEVSYSLQPLIRKYILVDPFNLVRRRTSVLQLSNSIQE
ncbi:AAA family ATPase [Nostoc sp. UIC 10607]|uniref:AAA family ATPase n=2 Tax=Nostoc TaxID=1177 RepID=A0ABR8IKB3_9NOSO|nr:MULTISPECIES: AAA family ATPase [Nostoc]MBD2564918.1 AAA family ATPase [Nostoc linckia FACHB-391]MBD2651396.1 AAA family ATPase [Nostoc foliaceum FACHB-393]